MKKFFALLISLVLMMTVCGAMAEATTAPSVEAEDVLVVEQKSPYFDVEMRLPEGAEATQEYYPEVDMTLITVTLAGGDVEFDISIAPSELYEGKRMADLTDEEITEIVNPTLEMFNEPTQAVVTLDSGNKLLVFEESTKDDDFAVMISLYKGYFVQAYIAHEDYAELEQSEIDDAIMLLNYMEFVDRQ